MKKAVVILFLIISINALSQTDYSGRYSFEKGPIVDLKDQQESTDDDLRRSRSGNLTLLKIDSTHYKFWILVASLNYIGDLDGVFIIQGNSGIYKSSKYSPDSIPCYLLFYLHDDYIRVEQKSSDMNCGFGWGVNIDDTFFLEKKNLITQSEFKNQYIEDAEAYKVTASKAIIYTDSTGTKNKEQYFVMEMK
ncbi:MAG TPA: hypothetical protein VN958_00390 [Chitinophagaceae bacterium]|nr:hypothetical protein [Chitinophagaceae bacterium]